jgi:Ca2+-binding EF-hand superfamily protein
MLSQEIHRFRIFFNKNSDAQARIVSGESVVEVARSLGYNFSESEFNNFIEDMDEMSDFELDLISGGDKCTG